MPLIQFDRRDLFTYANAFTFARLLCIPLFLWLLFGRENRAAAAWLLGGLGATDWVDGWLARRFDQVSEFGALSDPTVDRLMFLVVVASLPGAGSRGGGFLTPDREISLAKQRARTGEALVRADGLGPDLVLILLCYPTAACRGN